MAPGAILVNRESRFCQSIASTMARSTILKPHQIQMFFGTCVEKLRIVDYRHVGFCRIRVRCVCYRTDPWADPNHYNLEKQSRQQRGEKPPDPFRLAEVCATQSLRFWFCYAFHSSPAKGASDMVARSQSSAYMAAAHYLQWTYDTQRMCSSYWSLLLAASHQR